MVKNKYVILILAAGSSRRLGRPKQLVKWKQSTLLAHTVVQAQYSKECDVFVAIGGNRDIIHQEISIDVPTINIPNWQEGMGTSISTSLNQLDLENYNAVIISVCDQPYITQDIFQKLLVEFEKGNSGIIVSKYRQSSGPPALFDKKYYVQLLQLKGDIGAKEIVKNNSDDATFILFPNGDIDIDTESDVIRLRNND